MALYSDGNGDRSLMLRPVSTRPAPPTGFPGLLRRLALSGALAVLLTGAAAGAGKVPSPAAEAAAVITIGGAVLHPQSLAVADLERLPPTSLVASFATEHGQERATWTGVLLWTLLERAGIEAGPQAPPSGRETLRRTLVVTGRDGYAVAFSVGELDPDFGAAPAIVAYARDGAPLAAAQGLRLIVPGDKRGGRAVRDVVRIEVQ